MEYRRRRRTIQREDRNGAYPAYYAAAALFLAVAGLIGFSKPSTWVAERVLAPLFSGGAAEAVTLSDDPPDREDAAPVDAMVSRTVTLPAYACYALQIGIYEDEENAHAQAERLKRLGAAGRVAPDAGRYRVLASGYRTQADAKAVKQQLLEEGIDSYVYAIQCAERAYTVRGGETQAAALCDALAAVPEALDALYEAMIAFDKEGLPAGEGLAPVRAVAAQCEKHSSALLRLPGDMGGEIQGALAFHETLGAQALEVAGMEDAETAELSARIKGLYLAAVYARAALDGD